jgi:small subunit ribosomal protein S16
MVKLRFMRIGKKNRPYYRLCAIDVRRQRGGEYLEMIGVYDPLIQDDTRKIRINKERAEYWLSKGAQPSEGVFSFLKKAHVAGLIKPKKPTHQRPKPQKPVAQAPSRGTSRKPKPPKKPRAPKGEKSGPDAGAPPAQA